MDSLKGPCIRPGRDVDPEHLSRRVIGFLCVLERISAAAAVPHADIQVAVRPKASCPPLWFV